MKTRQSSVLLVLVLAAATAQALPARKQIVPSTGQATNSSPQIDRRADIYYDITMGHLYARQYVATNNGDDATRAIDFYKKAYALDPTSQVVGEQLAEIYFLSQRTPEAIKEARDVLRRDPSNLPVRRLLVRIYIRSLGELRDTTEQQTMVGQAIEQLVEIVRLDPKDSESALWLARLDRLSNRQGEAEKVLRAILVTSPDNELAVDQLAQLLMDQGKTDEAVALLEKQLASSPSAALYDRLGDAYTQMQDSIRAEQAYRRSAELDPSQASHLHGLAQSLTDQGKYQEAAVTYEKLVDMEPTDVSNYLRLSETYRHLHQLDKAEQQVLKAKMRAPGNLEVIYDEAAVYEAQARYDDAIRVLSDAVASVKVETEFTPARRRTLAILYQMLGQLYRDEQNYAPAINTLQEMARLGPEEDQRARLLIIDTYRADHDLPHAMDAARKAAADYPQERGFKLSQAFLLGDSKEYDQAAQMLRPLLNNSPADMEIYFALSEIYTQNRRYADAEQAIRSSEKLAQGPGEKETVYFLLADIYARQKKYDQAEQAFQTVLAINPRNASVLNYYGYMLADRGVRLEEAKAMIQRALAEDPDNAAFLDSLGWAYFKQGNLAEAESNIRKAVSRDARDPTMHSHLGDVLAKSGQPDLAAAEWEKAIAAWQRALPAEFEAAKVTELEQKISGLKNRVAQKLPGDTGTQ